MPADARPVRKNRVWRYKMPPDALSVHKTRVWRYQPAPRGRSVHKNRVWRYKMLSDARPVHKTRGRAVRICFQPRAATLQKRKLSLYLRVRSRWPETRLELRLESRPEAEDGLDRL